MKKTELKILSRDNRTYLHGFVWEPDTAPRAVLQLVHGMCEYIDRYHDFAAWLTGQGNAVIGHDHLGHGGSVIDESRLGYFSDGGYDIIIQDMHRLTEEAKSRFPALPLYILGHSMGSFMTRLYLTKYSRDVKGAVIMGTGFIPGIAASTGLFLSSLMTKTKGPFYKSSLLTNLCLGSNNKAFQPARTPFDWLSKNQENVDRYETDPLCGFVFTAAAYNDFFSVMKLLAARKDFDQIRKDLPVLIVSGSEDPVGGRKACPKVRDSLKKAGLTDITMKIYEDDRHEILNEDDRETVYRDILEWMDR